MPRKTRTPASVLCSAGMSGDPLPNACEIDGCEYPVIGDLDSDGHTVEMALLKGFSDLRHKICAEVSRLESLVSLSLQRDMEEGTEKPADTFALSNGSDHCGAAKHRLWDASLQDSEPVPAAWAANGAVASLNGAGLDAGVASPGSSGTAAEVASKPLEGGGGGNSAALPRSRQPAPSSQWRTSVTRELQEADDNLRRAAQLTSEISRRDSSKKTLNTFVSTSSYATASPLQRLTRSRHFEVFFTLMILVNTIFLSVQVQYNSDNMGKGDPVAFVVLNHILNLVFLLELILRLVSEGCKRFYCRKGSAAWAVLDTGMVVISVVDFAVDMLYAASLREEDNSIAAGSMRVLRMLRLARVMRTFRAFRLIRFMSALQTLIVSIVVTMRSLAWAAVLMLAIVFVFAVTFAQGAIDGYLVNADDRLLYYWGSLGACMNTLFQAISNGVSWRDACEVLFEASWICGCLFYVFIVFSYFVLLNVITGVFCNSAIESAQRNPELIAHSLKKSRSAYLKRLSALFDAVDSRGDGCITLADFEELLEDDMARAHFQALGLDVVDAWTLFKLVDADGSGTISISEFVTGCEALRGDAKSIDVASVLYESRQNSKKLLQYVHRIEERLTASSSDELPALPRDAGTATF